MIWTPAHTWLAVHERSTRTLRTYLLLLGELDVVRYRPVKQEWLAATLGIHKRDARRALHRLVHHGVLDRGPRAGRTFTYRLVATPGRARAARVSGR